MACFHRDGGDDGFATPAALAISLGLAMIVAAVMTLSVSALRASHSDFDKTRTEYAIAGDRLAAVQVLLGSTNTGRVRWDLPTDQGIVEVVAEPEGPKLSPQTAAAVAAALGTRLDAKDTDRLRAVLVTLDDRTNGLAEALETASPSPLWKLCIRSFVSRRGAASSIIAAPTIAPRPGPTNWRLGQLWRLRLTDSDGWTEDTVVRFTGAPGHPIAVVERRFTRSGPMGERCDVAA